MVFEDAHWIDPTSRELLDLTMNGSAPGGIADRYVPTEFEPPWTGQEQVSALALNRLGRRDRTVLAEQIAGGKTLPDEVVSAIADRTDGVPLFVEELTKNVLESGLLRQEADRYVLNGALPGLAIPTSLHASLLARFDRLTSVRRWRRSARRLDASFRTLLLRAVSHLPDDELTGSSRSFRRRPSWSPARDSAGRESIASSTRWCRTRCTARFCVRHGSNCTRRSPKRSKPILRS